MRIRSAIVLILWVASLSAPFMSLHGDECDIACCVMTANACPMEEHSEKCPGMQAGTPIHPIPAAPIITREDTVVLARPATIQVTLVDLQPDNQTIQARPDPAPILPLSAPLLI